MLWYVTHRAGRGWAVEEWRREGGRESARVFDMLWYVTHRAGRGWAVEEGGREGGRGGMRKGMSQEGVGGGAAIYQFRGDCFQAVKVSDF